MQMTPYGIYDIYQADLAVQRSRPRRVVERREADAQLGRLAMDIARVGDALVRPVRTLRSGRPRLAVVHDAA